MQPPPRRSGALPTSPSPLAPLHSRLASQFSQLRDSRDKLGGGKPIFALEHGLNEAETTELQRLVRIEVRIGRLPRDAWLPMVVYAAEVGYRYAGDQYWQTFESETPGWVDQFDREYVRDRFIEFAREFHGARPTGRWAHHFSIICWPITHAVLPTDLQRDLAELLYNLRHSLSTELLTSPDILGTHLAARAHWTSARFQNFAQNTALLGQVAAALLAGEKDGQPDFICKPTLSRIIADLGQERMARRWLSDARRSASRITLTGLERVVSKPSVHTERGTSRLGPLGLPRMYLTRRAQREDQWIVQADLPDFSNVPSSDLHSAISRRRCRVAGVEGPPLPTGALMFGRTVTLVRMPDPGTPLLALENTDATLNQALADECCLDPGPVWLFKLIEPNRAVEILGKSVHPGRDYIVAGRAIFAGRRPAWATDATIACEGLWGIEMHLPEVVGDREEAWLRTLGLALSTEVELRPVGMVAAGWDGEGRSEWIVGDPTLVALTTTREIVDGVATLDGGAPVRIEWTGPTTRKAFLDLGSLEVGQHVLRVSVQPSGQRNTPVDGSLTIAVREPQSRNPAGNYREAMVIRCSPAGPTLEEVWDRRATVEFIGPRGLKPEVRLQLEDGPGAPVATYRMDLPALPIEGKSWFEGLDELARGPASKSYDAANSCTIEASHPALGLVRLRCSREFKPLRWGIGHGRHGDYGRLYDNVGARDVVIERLDFATPDVRHRIHDDGDRTIHHDNGGLLVASWRDYHAAVILPPVVHNLEDAGRALVRPWIESGGRSAETISRWIELSDLWYSARLPGNVIAKMARDQVLQALCSSIGCVIGGRRWTPRERAIATARSQTNAIRAWEESASAVGEDDYQRMVAVDVKRSVRDALSQSLDERCERFARHLRRLIPKPPHDRDHLWLSGFLLRLGSAPNEAREWAGPACSSAIHFALANPVTVRAARFYVLGVYLLYGDGVRRGCYAGWEWE